MFIIYIFYFTYIRLYIDWVAFFMNLLPAGKSPQKIIYIYIYIYIYICIYVYSEGKNHLIPRWFCTLKKKWSVYNFNGRFIWTVRDRITIKKNQKNAFKNSYKLICILMSEISISPLRKTWLGDKTLVGNHRGQTFLVVGHQVCTHLRRDFVPLLFADSLQVIKVLRLTFGNSNLQLPPQIFYVVKVWWLARPLQDLNVFLLELLLCCFSRVFWVTVMLEYPSTNTPKA